MNDYSENLASFRYQSTDMAKYLTSLPILRLFTNYEIYIPACRHGNVKYTNWCCQKHLFFT